MYKTSFSYHLLIYSPFLCSETFYVIGISVTTKHQRNCASVSWYIFPQLDFIWLCIIWKGEIISWKLISKLCFHSIVGIGIKLQCIFICPSHIKLLCFQNINPAIWVRKIYPVVHLYNNIQRIDDIKHCCLFLFCFCFCY